MAKCASSSTLKSVRRPSQAVPAGGGGASAGTSAAQQSAPARRPRYSVRAGSNHKGLLFFSNGRRAQEGRRATRRSPESAPLGGPSSTSKPSPRKTKQWAPALASGGPNASSQASRP